MEKSIKYQNFCGRIFAFIPAIFVLACIEYQIVNKVLSDKEYILLSIVLTIIFANVYLRCSKNLFLKEAHYKIAENQLFFSKGKDEIVLNLSDLKDVEIRKVYMYGVTVARLTISYCVENNRKTLVLYSRDLTDGQMEKQELWDFYNKLSEKCI